MEGVKQEAGYGFTAWVDHNRIILGNRAMMARHDIELPSMDYENRYTKTARVRPFTWPWRANCTACSW